MSDIPTNTLHFSRSNIDTRAREEYIVGKPPRVQPLEKTQLTERQQQLIEKLGTIVIDGEAIERDDKESIEIMARHPELFAAHMDLAAKFMTHGELSIRDRELAILRIGWLSQAPFEWGMHVNIAKQNGVTPEQIEWLTEGSSAAGWNQHDRAIVRAVEELHYDSMITDETWAALAESLNEEQLIELTILAGQYKTVAYYQNSLRHRLSKYNQKGLSAR